MAGVAFPALFFLLAAAGGLTRDGLHRREVEGTRVMIALSGFVGARVSGVGAPRALFQASAVALIGGLLIALKALVH